MYEIIKLFKKEIPRPKKIYRYYCEQNHYTNLSYNEFKNNNVELIEIMLYLESLNDYNYVSKRQINNMFDYLNYHLKKLSINKIRKNFNLMDDLTKDLDNKINSHNLHTKESLENCKLIINRISNLKDNMSYVNGFNQEELTKIIDFEDVTNKILYPKKYKINGNLIYNIFNNMDKITFYNHKKYNFNDLYISAIIKSKITHNNNKYKYYKSLYNYIYNIKELELDNNYINELFDLKVSKIYDNILDEKISKLKYNKQLNKYIIDKDYILSLDNNDTRKIDDAFSIEKIDGSYIVGIHLADVFSLGLFKENSFDFSHNDSFDEPKSNASLMEDKYNNAVSLYVLIDNNGIILDYKLINTIINVEKNLIYDDIPKILKDDLCNTDLKKTVINLINLYAVLENEKFPPVPTINNLSYLIVNKLMVLCGCVISDHFYDNNIPAPHMIKENSYTLDKSNFNTGFKDFNTYSKVTSPIYDKSSLICQYIIHKCIFNKISDENKEILTNNLKPLVKKLNK